MFIENFLVFPAPRFPQGDWDPEGIVFEDIYFNSADGTQLHGWYFEHARPRAHVLYCHGNGEHVAYLADYLNQVRDELKVSIFAFDYRGYGRSKGAPNEVGVLADGEAAHSWLASRSGQPGGELVLMGRSLGGAVVIDLASRHRARALAVQNTFTSLPDVAARLYWWVPVRWLMRNRFESLQKIARYDGPLLIGHGAEDGLVPSDQAQTLLHACPSEKKELIEFPRAGHNDPASVEFYQAFDTLLEDTSC